MSGPEHYREAERVLDHAEENAAGESAEWYIGAVTAAQVHATLAQTAAIAQASGLMEPVKVDDPDNPFGVLKVASEWDEAIS